jgi:molybdopterin-guanine dinucleotide biosynthesis protein A
MGTSKALLAFGPETMLQRVLRLLSTVVSPVVVVAAAEQSLPGLLTDHDVAVMEIDGFAHPLSAVYRRSTLPHVEALLAEGRLRPAFLFDAVRTRRVQEAEMISADPRLLTLRNLNTPEDYREALSIASEANRM